LTESGDIHFVVNALAYQNNGSAYNPDLVATPASSARLYDSVYIRHWDFYIAPERYAVFSGTIKASTNGTGYSFDGTTHNLLWGIEAPVTLPETPVQPFGDLGDYDLSPDGSQVVFLTKAPELAKANYTASYLYLVPHDGSSVAEKINGPGSSAPEAAQGASGAPVWSPDGCKIAYFQQDGVYYESDLSKLYIADVSSGAASASITQLIPKFDYSVASITWSADGESLYLVAGYQGSNRLFIVPVDAEDDFVPKPLTDNTSLSTFSILPDGSALVSASAVWSSRNFYIVTPEGETTKLYFANEEDPLLAGLGPDDFDTFWYNGTLGDLVSSPVHPHCSVLLHSIPTHAIPRLTSSSKKVSSSSPPTSPRTRSTT
jgi:Tol biopolymer transport system component